MGDVDSTVEDRQARYGHPKDNFARCAELWNAYLHAKYGITYNVGMTAEDVGHLLILLKQSREMHAHDDDNIHDIAGYAKCLEMIHSDNVQKA